MGRFRSGVLAACLGGTLLIAGIAGATSVSTDIKPVTATFHGHSNLGKGLVCPTPNTINRTTTYFYGTATGSPSGAHLSGKLPLQLTEVQAGGATEFGSLLIVISQAPYRTELKGSFAGTRATSLVGVGTVSGKVYRDGKPVGRRVVSNVSFSVTTGPRISGTLGSGSGSLVGALEVGNCP